MDLKHFFTVKNGVQIFEDEKLYKSALKQYEGKRGVLILKSVKKTITPSQYSYYFGYILIKIREEMFDFRGWEVVRIHNYFWKYLMPGKDFSSADRNEFGQYIDELIPYLIDKYNLFINIPTKFSKVISS